MIRDAGVCHTANTWKSGNCMHVISTLGKGDVAVQESEKSTRIFFWFFCGWVVLLGNLQEYCTKSAKELFLGKGKRQGLQIYKRAVLWKQCKKHFLRGDEKAVLYNSTKVLFWRGRGRDADLQDSNIVQKRSKGALFWGWNYNYNWVPEYASAQLTSGYHTKHIQCTFALVPHFASRPDHNDEQIMHATSCNPLFPIVVFNYFRQKILDLNFNLIKQSWVWPCVQ